MTACAADSLVVTDSNVNNVNVLIVSSSFLTNAARDEDVWIFGSDENVLAVWAPPF